MNKFFDWALRSKYSKPVVLGILTVMAFAAGIVAWLVFGDQGRENQALIELNKAPWTNNALAWGIGPSNTLIYITNSYSAPNPNDIHKSDVLTNLLERDREEVKFWQDKFFTISFWVDAAILAIVGFVIEKFVIEKGKRRLASPTSIHISAFCACLALCIFYVIFALEAEDAMVTNDCDLQGIQGALGLRQSGFYLNGQPIYGNNTDDIPKLAQFLKTLPKRSDPMSKYLAKKLPGDLRVEAISNWMSQVHIFDAAAFKRYRLRPETIATFNETLAEFDPGHPKSWHLKEGPALLHLNRLLLEDAYPLEASTNLYGSIGHKFIAKFVCFNVALVFGSSWVLLWPILGPGSVRRTLRQNHGRAAVKAVDPLEPIKPVQSGVGKAANH